MLERPLQPVQWAAIIGSLVVGLWSIAGLIANPDFTIGDGNRLVVPCGQSQCRAVGL